MEILDAHGDSSLFDLIERGAHEPALELLKGDNHTSEDELNKSLMASCQHGHKLLIQMLTECGANVNFKDTNGNTPLMISVQNGFSDIVQFLLTNKADVNAINSAGDSALILSTGSSGSREVIRNLLKQPEINIDHQNHDGYTAIMKAAELKNIVALKMLLDKYFNVDGTETSVSFYECVDEHKTHKRSSDVVAASVSKWTMLEDTVNFRRENIQQIANRCEIRNVFQLLQEYVDTRISPLELAIRADDIKSFIIFLGCAFNYAAHNKKYLNFMLKHIFKTCCNTDIDFSENKIAMVKALLEHGADVSTSWYGQTVFVTKSPSKRFHYKRGSTTPVHVAAEKGYYKVLELLLSFKPAVNRYGFQNSPLHIALSHGHTHCADLLVQHGAVIDFDRAMEFAADQQEPVYMRFLINSYTVESKNYLTSYPIENILLESVRKGSLEFIGLVLDLGANINGSDSKCPLAECINGEVAKFLIDRGADVKHIIGNYLTGYMPLIAKRLIDNNIIGYTPLISVLICRNIRDYSVIEIVQVLLENGASVNEPNQFLNTPLMLAAKQYESMSVLQLLLDHGAKLGEKDDEGNTALIHAVKVGCSKNVSVLLQAIRDRKEILNEQNDAGLTALMLAVKARSETIIKELIDKGADVNIKDRNGDNALLHLLRPLYKQDDKIIRLLVQAGCDVNWQNNDGLSSLMVAAQKHLEIEMLVLLDSGAEINAVSKTNGSETALSHLQYGGQKYFSCLEYLLDRGASLSFLTANTLHKLIVDDKIHIVLKLIRCGLGPVNVLGDGLFSDSTANKNMLYSPLCTALCTGNSALAHFFVDTLFLTQSDISSLSHDKMLRQYLERRDYQKCLDVLDAIPTRPMSLENLSFMAVSTAVGYAPGREIRVNELELPRVFKDKLLFKSQNTLLRPPGTDLDVFKIFVDDSDNSQ